MIKNGTGGANTISGLDFEKRISINKTGIDITKYKLYKYLESKGINYLDFISKKLLPDEAYIDEENKIVTIYEKKYQNTQGSVDEKPQSCDFKIKEFRKLFKSIDIPAENISYTYIFNDWFSKPEYKDMLEYINETDGCNYIIVKEN